MAPASLTVALTLGTLAALTAASKSAAVWPSMVTVTAAATEAVSGCVAAKVNVELVTNTGVVSVPVITVAPVATRSSMSMAPVLLL